MSNDDTLSTSKLSEWALGGRVASTYVGSFGGLNKLDMGVLDMSGCGILVRLGLGGLVSEWVIE